MAQKPSIPKGTRDFSPVEMAKRNYIFNSIKEVFALYGFQQIETPAMENLSTLMGKYGEEGDKLLFKILNSGDFLHGMTADEVANTSTLKLAAKFCEKGLRYDLTVPFARYVVQHREELALPFKRYQIQPVWRADRPQKGRYREFYQCDADVVGSDSLLYEVEIIQMIDAVFTKFGARVCIKVNNRKILSGIAEMIGQADKIVDITVAMDKLDKIGLAGVNAELAGAGVPAEAIEKLQPIIELRGTNEEKLATMKEVLHSLHPAVIAMIFAAGLKIVVPALFPGTGAATAVSEFSLRHLLIFLGALFVLRKWKSDPIKVMVGCGAVELAYECAARYLF